jgi:hypothetical protein
MDETSFADAETMAVAGRINREDSDDEPDPPPPHVILRCWPAGRTHEVPEIAPPPPPSPVYAQDMMAVSPLTVVNDQMITVTGSRIATQEELGDVKLYRLPERVTVASNSQKQIAFIAPRSVEVRTIYRSRIQASDTDEQEVTRILVTRNRSEEGLGLPLPAGGVVLFDRFGQRPILLGEGSLDDHAVGEDIEIELNRESEGEVSGLTVRIEEENYGKDWADYVITVANDRPYPVAYEAEFVVEDDERMRPRSRLGRRDGRPLWSVTVPANGSASLRYRVRELPDPDED